MEDAPSLTLERIHIRGLRGLERLNLPEAGMGWGGRFPAVATIGGGNGSGKSTLLRCIAMAGCSIATPFDDLRMESAFAAQELRLDFSFHEGGAAQSLRFLVGDEAFIRDARTENSTGFKRVGQQWRPFRTSAAGQLCKRLSGHEFVQSTTPRVLFFPSDGRELVVPSDPSYRPAELRDDAGFVVLWDRGAETTWKGSTAELFFAARWADLVAKEENRPEDATNFLRYTRSFAEFTGGAKQIGWSPKGELIVKLASGVTHPLDELSAGERQAVLLLAELRRYWRPGSLVLIDEPELHLHDAWQGQLYDVLLAMQKELGGQVILTTQSHSLFAMADSDTRALLGLGGLK